ncbi:putative pyrophosphatase [Gottschalkia purinilytica]|uniref:Putative pyrophosphatase n=1 Tax=Gottschalkia purinilytica TaxID=1503 RepID=A0A0L0W9Y9_GOTPU|nr:MazG nucleotide pyrophosphohydrolase domain-containing protein [Gottschalkia purinilytica]KNF08363.1 putative pyrophosphatase [Gottschalkia purinilytica]
MNLLDAQKQVSNFTKDKELKLNVNTRIIDLVSEVGELSKEILKGTNYGNKPFEKTEEWESEIGDVLFSLICIANETNTNLKDCLSYVLDKYEKRFINKGNLGSGR